MDETTKTQISTKFLEKLSTLRQPVPNCKLMFVGTSIKIVPVLDNNTTTRSRDLVYFYYEFVEDVLILYNFGNDFSISNAQTWKLLKAFLEVLSEYYRIMFTINDGFIGNVDIEEVRDRFVNKRTSSRIRVFYFSKQEVNNNE